MRFDLKGVGLGGPGHASARENGGRRKPGWIMVGLVVAVLSIVALPSTIPSGLGPILIVASAVILVLLFSGTE